MRIRRLLAAMAVVVATVVSFGTPAWAFHEGEFCATAAAGTTAVSDTTGKTMVCSNINADGSIDSRYRWRAQTAPATTTTTTTTVPDTTPPTTVVTSQTCDPNYAGACVPIATDVDCAGGSGNGPVFIDATDFQVVGTDIYGLDANGDGVACETSAGTTPTTSALRTLAASTTTGGVARTGVDSGQWATEAGALVILGGTLLIAARRRRRWPAR